MKSWTRRPKEEAILLNPAFCCSILAASIQAYSETAKKGMPFALIFMVLPILLHKATRESLPHDTRTSMPVWLQEHGSARVLFYERTMSLKAYSKEAIWFGIRAKRINLGPEALLETDLKKADVERSVQKLTDDARECLMRARFLGKWFALAGPANTVMSFWGIRP